MVSFCIDFKMAWALDSEWKLNIIFIANGYSLSKNKEKISYKNPFRYHLNIEDHFLPKNHSPFTNTVGINPIISDLNTPQTSKLGRGTLKSIKLIGMNSRFVNIHKKAHEQKCLKNWTILKNLKERKKKSNFSPVLNQGNLLMTGWLGLVANKYTKFGKTSDNLLLSQGLS